MSKLTNFNKMIIVLLWFSVIYFLYDQNLITLNRDSIIEYINKYSNYTKILFILLASARILIFIPGIVFMIIGGILFDPFTGFFLSMLSMIISETLIYFLSKMLNLENTKEKLIRKYTYIEPLLKEYDYKFLSLGIITPIAPTDIICFLSALSGIKYGKYILTVIITNIPMMLLYSSMGNSFGNSIFSSLLIIFSIILCCSITIQVWLKLKNDINKDDSIDQAPIN